jgi:peroxiredoxin
MHCQDQLGGLAHDIWQFQRLAVPIIAVSADAPNDIRSMDEHIRSALLLLSDRRLALIEPLGLTDTDSFVSHRISRPAAFGVGSDGNIHYRFVGRNERDRPPAALLLLAAQRLAASRG